MTPDQAFALFGIHPPSLLSLARSPQHAQVIWKGIKDTVKRSFRSKAKTLHPDVVGGDHERMAELNAAKDLILPLKLRMRQPQQNVILRTVMHVYGPAFFNDVFNATSSISTGPTNGWNWNINVTVGGK